MKATTDCPVRIGFFKPAVEYIPCWTTAAMELDHAGSIRVMESYHCFEGAEAVPAWLVLVPARMADDQLERYRASGRPAEPARLATLEDWQVEMAEEELWNRVLGD